MQNVSACAEGSLDSFYEEITWYAYIARGVPGCKPRWNQLGYFEKPIEYQNII
jgi:hypothetical protein